MALSRKENSSAHRLLKCLAPDAYTKAMAELSKIRCTLDVHRVSTIKEAFDSLGYTDKRAFIAVVFKKYHPKMYAEDNRALTLKQGLCKAVAEQIGMKESNCSVMFKEVRAWLKNDMYDLRTQVEEIFPEIESKLLTINTDKCKPCLF